MNAAPAILAGLGLFFVGTRFVGDHMQLLATRRVRQALARAMSRRGVAPAAGLLLGGIVQNTSGVTFLAVGLLSSGLVTLGPSMSLLAWSNVSTSALVFLSTVDLRSIALYLLALVGLLYVQGFDRNSQGKHLVNAGLGLGLLFLGLSLVREGVAVVRSSPWTEEFVAFSSESTVIALLVGAVAAVAAQSSATVTVLALPLVNAGILQASQTAMLVYGASIGSGLSVLLLSSNLEGTSRQLALYQASMKLLGAAIFVPLAFLEAGLGVPLVHAGVTALSQSASTQVALVYLAFQVGAAAAGQLLQAPMRALLAALSPPTAVEALARPHFLYDEAVADPDTALALVERERTRLVQQLPGYLDSLRPASERAGEAVPLPVWHAANAGVVSEIDLFLSELVEANPAFDGVERVFDARARLHALQLLQNCLVDFVAQAGGQARSEGSLMSSLIEALHVMLDTSMSAAESGDPEDLQLIESLTEDRSGVMTGVRKRLASEHAEAAVRESQLVSTMLFERCVWLIRDLHVRTNGE